MHNTNQFHAVAIYQHVHFLEQGLSNMLWKIHILDFSSEEADLQVE